jgi:DNA-binding PadR family transcriptional regulator
MPVIRGSSDRSVLVLTSLSSGPKHGYALIKDIESFSGITLGPGSLYGAIDKLEHAGLIKAMPGEGRRKPYRITARGTSDLREQLTLSEKISSVGLGRLAGAGGS